VTRLDTARQRIRQIYEDHPYPGPERVGIEWRLAPMAWMQALWRPGAEATPPRRILVAGCGTGAEAFAVRRAFPAADIVAFDFSDRSIAEARRTQRRRRGAPVRFEVADLASPRLGRIVGRDFDFVSCHGVMTYVPEPQRALGNLARCLAPDGALYLGVNGSRHRSVALRQVLPMFGVDPGRFVESPSAREVVRLLDALLPSFERIARPSAPYLASDVFGPLFHNWPLARWVEVAHGAGLHFQASYTSQRQLRPLVERGLCERLAPRTRAEVSLLLEIAQPAGFHRVLFTRQPPASPPWTEPLQLIHWRPVRTRLYRSRLPVRTTTRPRTFTFRSRAINTMVSAELPSWSVPLLRDGNGARSIGAILRRVGTGPDPHELAPHLYLLHQLLILNLLPPRTA